MIFFILSGLLFDGWWRRNLMHSEIRKATFRLFPCACTLLYRFSLTFTLNFFFYFLYYQVAAKYECYHFHFHLPCTLPTSYFKFKLYFKHLRKGHILIVGFLFQPAAWVASQVEATNLVVHEDGQAEWQSWEPPHESTKESGTVSKWSATSPQGHHELSNLLQWIHAKTLVHAGCV